jgi:hypothetical protein
MVRNNPSVSQFIHAEHGEKGGSGQTSPRLGHPSAIPSSCTLALACYWLVDRRRIGPVIR